MLAGPAAGVEDVPDETALCGERNESRLRPPDIPWGWFGLLVRRVPVALRARHPSSVGRTAALVGDVGVVLQELHRALPRDLRLFGVVGAEQVLVVVEGVAGGVVEVLDLRA